MSAESLDYNELAAKFTKEKIETHQVPASNIQTLLFELDKFANENGLNSDQGTQLKRQFIAGFTATKTGADMPARRFPKDPRHFKR